MPPQKKKEAASLDMSYPSRTKQIYCTVCYRLVYSRKLKRHQRSRACSDVARALKARSAEHEAEEKPGEEDSDEPAKADDNVFRIALALVHSAERYERKRPGEHRSTWRQIRDVAKAMLRKKKEEEKQQQPEEVIIEPLAHDAVVVEQLRVPLLAHGKRHTCPAAVKPFNDDVVDEEDTSSVEY